MKKMIRSSEIKEFALNPEYFIKEDMETLINKGFLARWMNEDEGTDKDLYFIFTEENK